MPESNLPVVTEKPVRVSKSGKPLHHYIPSVEKPEHRAMYAFYHSLGKNRTIQKVAKEFGRSVSYISTLSRAFQWQLRIKTTDQEITDPVIAATKDKVDDARRKLVSVVHNITDTLFEMSELSTKVKQNDLEELNDQDLRRAKILVLALQTFGIHIEKPKDMRDLITVLKEITKFNADALSQSTGSGTQEINIDKMQLVIKDD